MTVPFFADKYHVLRSTVLKALYISNPWIKIVEDTEIEENQICDAVIAYCRRRAEKHEREVGKCENIIDSIMSKRPKPQGE